MRRLQQPVQRPVASEPDRKVVGNRKAPDPRAFIRSSALKIGFDAVGFCPANLGPEVGQHLADFIQAGYHGDMGWLAAKTDKRSDPKRLWPEVKSVVVLGLSYAPEEDPLDATRQKSNGAISVYARNRDYHDVAKGKLKHLAQAIVSRFKCEVKVFVDTAPVMEKPLAQRSGLGWQGKHTNLVSRRNGSWLLLGEIYTTMDLQPDEPVQDHCGSCVRCLEICPTKAFVGPHQLDARRCISYLTIEHKGSIPHDLRRAIGNRIYGCDDCLAVCPWNKFANPTSHAQLKGRDPLSAPQLQELAALDDGAFRSKFAGSPIKRIGRDRFVRNVLIAIGNSGDAALRPAAEALRHDRDAVVAESAEWAVEQLHQPSSLSSSARE